MQLSLEPTLEYGVLLYHFHKFLTRVFDLVSYRCCNRYDGTTCRFCAAGKHYLSAPGIPFRNLVLWRRPAIESATCRYVQFYTLRIAFVFRKRQSSKKGQRQRDSAVPIGAPWLLLTRVPLTHAKKLFRHSPFFFCRVIFLLTKIIWPPVFYRTREDKRPSWYWLGRWSDPSLRHFSWYQFLTRLAILCSPGWLGVEGQRTLPGTTRAVIAPHAGFRFVAACCFHRAVWYRLLWNSRPYCTAWVVTTQHFELIGKCNQYYFASERYSHSIFEMCTTGVMSPTWYIVSTNTDRWPNTNSTYSTNMPDALNWGIWKGTCGRTIWRFGLS